MTDFSIRWNRELAIIFRQERTNQTEIKALLESHILSVPANVNQLSQIRIIIKKPTVPAMTNEEASTSSIKYKRTKK